MSAPYRHTFLLASSTVEMVVSFCVRALLRFIAHSYIFQLLGYHFQPI